MPVEIVRYIYLSAFRFEQAYRARVAPSFESDSRIEKAFQETRSSLGRKLDKLGAWREQFGLVWEIALLLAQNETDQPFLAGKTIDSIHANLMRLAPDSAQVFEASLSSDWEWCEPLDSQEPGDMQNFFVQPLWAAGGSRDWTELLGRWLGRVAEAAQISTRADDAAMFKYYVAHLHGRPLDWLRMKETLPAGEAALLSTQELEALTDLAESPIRVASLLARIALHDRSRCDLAGSPSLAAFKEATQALGRGDAASLIAFEKELRTAQSSFEPNKLWLAWINNACQPAIDSIRSELRSWLPLEPAPASAETVSHLPISSLPVATARVRPAARKAVAKAPAIKRRAMKK
ncbi:MAG: hypothetical protein QOE70_966 [Chthoniobacter sp.]|nr:hypothetical protein [Chthoniobacter sp.]